MKKILLLQFRTDASRKHEFEQILKMGGFDPSEIKVVNVLDKRFRIPKPEDVDKYKAVITGASGQFNVTDWPKDVQSRIRLIYPFIRALVNSDTPTLSICFGHQLVSKLFGGEIESDDKQAEAGVYEISLTKEGKQSNLFKGVPAKFLAVSGHKDSITKLPKIARLLAYSKNCRVHSYKLTDNFYAVQFHPELDRRSLAWRLSLYPEYMKGKTLKEVEKSFRPVPYAHKVIENFRTLINATNEVK